MKIKKEVKWMQYVLLVILLSAFSIAQPMPLGVDGTVYDLDGITKAGNNVMFSVNDLDSGFYVEGNLKAGRYSAVINGMPGDTLLIRVWTLYHNSTNNLTIIGSMHGFDILLDLSMPNQAPDIISEPLTEAYEDSLYSYDVNATDVNGDILEYSLLQAPSNMLIDPNSGVITWLLSEEDVGSYTIIVNVSDGFLSDTQDYLLQVINVTPVKPNATNNAPVFISVPLTKVVLWNLYVYDADANDSDGDAIVYSLITRPNFMYINRDTGKIFWIPYKTGDFKVVVSANDSKNVSYQEYIIAVEKGNANYYASATEFNGTANRLTITNPNLDVINLIYKSEKQDNLLIYSGKSKEYFGFEKTRDKLYKYIVIGREEDFFSKDLAYPTEGKINFRVKKNFISGFSSGNIRLAKYNPQNRRWEYLPTSQKKENWEYYFYESEINSFGIFAIVAKVPKETIQRGMDNLFYRNQFEQPRRPFIVTGKIILEDPNLSTDGFDYELKNLGTGEAVKGRIIGNVYSDILSGEIGDEYSLVISKGDYKKELTSRITADLTRQDMKLDINPEQYKEIMKREKTTASILMMLAFLTVFGILLSVISFHLARGRWK